MDKKGYIHLTDFGMARLLKLDKSVGNFYGTICYLAPEVVRAEE